MPGREFEVFDEAGHFPHHTDPARFVRVLCAFMERTTPATFDAHGWRARLLRGARASAAVPLPAELADTPGATAREGCDGTPR